MKKLAVLSAFFLISVIAPKLAQAECFEVFGSSCSGDFAEGGDLDTAERLIGNTSCYALGILQNNKVRIFISSGCAPGQVSSSPLSGFVGIMTNGQSMFPQYPLDVWGVMRTTGGLIIGTTQPALTSTTGIGATNYWLLVGTHVVILKNGNVGFNTSNPGSRFEVLDATVTLPRGPASGISVSTAQVGRLQFDDGTKMTTAVDLTAPTTFTSWVEIIAGGSELHGLTLNGGIMTMFNHTRRQWRNSGGVRWVERLETAANGAQDLVLHSSNPASGGNNFVIKEAPRFEIQGGSIVATGGNSGVEASTFNVKQKLVFPDGTSMITAAAAGSGSTITWRVTIGGPLAASSTTLKAVPFQGAHWDMENCTFTVTSARVSVTVQSTSTTHSFYISMSSANPNDVTTGVVFSRISPFMEVSTKTGTSQNWTVYPSSSYIIPAHHTAQANIDRVNFKNGDLAEEANISLRGDCLCP